MKTLMQIRNGLLQKLSRKRKLELSLVVSSDSGEQVDPSHRNANGESKRKKIIHERESDNGPAHDSSKKLDRINDSLKKQDKINDSGKKRNGNNSSKKELKLIDFLKKQNKISDSLKKRHKIYDSPKRPNKKSHSVKKQGNSVLADQSVSSSSRDKDDGSSEPERSKRRRKHRSKKDKAVLDEASKLQRRARYLMVKLKLEQNLIDAYLGEGWKGQSREKIKPEKELQRAKEQILKCKLGIRDAVRQLDLLGSVGQIDVSLVSPDGCVHHEHIFCKKCKSQDVSEDNDIILCDGTCNCAFHQKCIDPPLATADIPPEDEGWLCKYCDSKTDIIDAMNAHLGTQFSADSNWEDIFKEALLYEDGAKDFNPGEEWPDDESDDTDYDPSGDENSSSGRCNAMEGSSSHEESSTSSSCCSLESELYWESGLSPERTEKISNISPLPQKCVSDPNDTEIISGPRRRADVDYIKLYDEMFAGATSANDILSEDEDWGPRKRRRREKECNAASTLMELCESEVNHSDSPTLKMGKNHLMNEKVRKPLSRMPCDVLQKLRQAFAENELPSMSIKKKIAELVGLEYQKVNKWFKNARYLALKKRKRERSSPQFASEKSDCGVDKIAETTISKSSTSPDEKKQSKKVSWNSNLTTFMSPVKRLRLKRASFSNAKVIRQANGDLTDDMSLKKYLLYLKAKRNRKSRGRNGSEHHKGQNVETQMEQLWQLESKLWKLKHVLSKIRSCSNDESNVRHLLENHVIYVPVAEIREK